MRDKGFRRILSVEAACAGLALAAPRVLAQSSPVASDTAEHRRTWVSISLGPATANGAPRIGGLIALWTTKGPVAFSIRDAGASRAFDPGDVGDFSFLAGMHPVRQPRADVVILAGIGESYGHSTTGEDLDHEPVLAASAQMNLNYVVVGVGIDAFAAVGSGRRYYGAGLALGVGWFR